MEHPIEYLGLLVAVMLAVAIAGLILFLNSILGPKGHGSEAKSEPFECGMRPISGEAGRFGVKFYLLAMLFILFDVEIVWLFPWAVILREIKWTGLFEMFGFLAVLLIGFIYAWKKGALEWEK